MTRRKHTARDIPKLAKGIHCFDPTLYLRVQGTGARSWIQRITINGRQVDRGLGGWPLVTLEDARLTALSNRRAVRAGRDPFTDRDNARTAGTAPTFETAVDAWLESVSGKSALSIKAYRSTCNRLRPLFGRPVADVSRTELIAVLQGIASTASREKALKVARRIFDVAIVREWRGDNPAENGGIRAIVGIENGKVHGNHAAADFADVPGAFGRLTEAGTPASLCMAFIVATGLRLSEAAGLRWAEIDDGAAVVTIPGGRMKGSHGDHRIPATDAVRAILAARRGAGRGPLVFGPAAPSADAVRKAAKLAGLPNAHGVRASFRSWAAATGQDREAAEHQLAHVVGGKVERTYQRDDLLQRRRTLMTAWADHLTR